MMSAAMHRTPVGYEAGSALLNNNQYAITNARLAREAIAAFPY